MLEAFALALGAVANLVEILKSALPFDARKRNEICRILRMIYFEPNGVLSILRQLAQGKRVPDEQVAKVLIAFNDEQWEIVAALDALPRASSKDLRVSMKNANILADIRAGKLSVRQAVQDEINCYGQPLKQPDPARIRKLIRKIEQLNKKIEQIEDVIHSGARSP